MNMKQQASQLIQYLSKFPLDLRLLNARRWLFSKGFSEPEKKKLLREYLALRKGNNNLPNITPLITRRYFGDAQ
jgi:hypothetical protein